MARRRPSRALLLAGAAIVLAVAIVVAVATLNRPTTPTSEQPATGTSASVTASGPDTSDDRPDRLRNNVVVDTEHHLAYAATDAGVKVVNTASGDPVTLIPAGVAHSALALDVKAGRLYVAGPENTMRVIDTATNRELGGPTYDAHLSGIALDVAAERGYPTPSR